MNDTRRQINDFIASNRLTMTMTATDENPAMRDESWDMDNWRCTIRNACGDRMTVTFSMGKGHKGKEPTIADVLDCLASDASSYESARDFADFAIDLGYADGAESLRKGLRAYKAIARQNAGLRRLLGNQYDALVYETERL